nr:hypothetical protein [Tanacetum cinerariifolium]
MIDILEKYEHNVDFHLIVDFVEVSYIRVETLDEGTKILATVDGKPRTISESSIKRNLKLKDEAGISSLPDAELFENLTLMGYNFSPNQKFTFQKGHSNIATDVGEGSGTPTEPNHTPSLEAPQSPQHDLSSLIHPPVTTATIPTVISTDTLPLRKYTKRARIAQSSALPTVKDLEISTLKARIKLLEDRDGGGDDPSGEDATIKGRGLETGEEACIERSTDKGSNEIEEMYSPASEIPTVSVLTGSGVVLTASPIFTTAIVAAPYSRRKDLSIGERIELINDLVKYQDTYAKVLKYQSQQRKPLSKKQQKEFYMSIEDFVPMGSKEEGERMKRKGIRLEQESPKKVKTSEEVSDEDLKEMMQLVPVEEVYMEALLVKHPIIDWEIHTEGQRSYWKIIRLGGSTTSYQFFVDMLKHFDKEDLNQL